MTEAERLAKALDNCAPLDFDGDFTKAASLLRSQAAEIEALRAERDSLLSDWNDIVKASGSKTNGGAIGHVNALRADAEQLRLSLTFIVDRDLTYFDGYVDRHQIGMGAIEQARRVLKSGAAIDAARQS